MEALPVRGKATRASSGTWLCKASHRPGTGRTRAEAGPGAPCERKVNTLTGDQGRPCSENGTSFPELLEEPRRAAHVLGWQYEAITLAF